MKHDRMRELQDADMCGSVGMRPPLGAWGAGRWRSGWKVVREYDDAKRVYISAFGCGGRGRVLYWLEQPTRPRENHGALAVFKTLETAEEFVSEYSEDMIAVPCVYLRSGRECFVPSLSFVGEQYQSLEIPPEGTDYAEAVVLLRPVDKLEGVRCGDVG